MDNKKLSWSNTPLNIRPKNIGWSENAKITNGTVAYVLYFNNDTNIMCLDDLREKVTYEIPSGAKYKGYVLAYKLNKIYKETKE